MAATTEVTSAVSSRQTSQATRSGRMTGVKAMSTPEVTTTVSSASARMLRLAPGMSSWGSSGPSPSRSAATPRRAKPMRVERTPVPVPAMVNAAAYTAAAAGL